MLRVLRLQRPVLLIGLTALIVAAAQPAERIGGMLRPGMQLVYESGGVQTSWVIDSVAHDTTLGVRTGCVRIRLRTSPDQTVVETRAYCADSAMLLTWDGATRVHRPSRLLQPNSSLRLPERLGGAVAYTTGASGHERIGTLTVRIIPTTVLSRDFTGRVTRRLRERFSIGLATATGGIFEVPDSTVEGGRTVVQKFELVTIRP